MGTFVSLCSVEVIGGSVVGVFGDSVAFVPYTNNSLIYIVIFPPVVVDVSLTVNLILSVSDVEDTLIPKVCVAEETIS